MGCFCPSNVGFYATFKFLSGQAGTVTMRLPDLTDYLCGEMHERGERCAGQVTKQPVQVMSACSHTLSVLLD